MTIRLVKKEDISQIAEVYMKAFNHADVGEKWTLEKAEER